MSILQKLKNRDLDLEEKKAVLLAKLEEAELGERAALLEASRIKEDNEGLKVSSITISHRVGNVGIAMIAFFREMGKCLQNAMACSLLAFLPPSVLRRCSPANLFD